MDAAESTSWSDGGHAGIHRKYWQLTATFMTTVSRLSRLVNLAKAVTTIAVRLRYDYDPTTT